MSRRWSLLVCGFMVCGVMGVATAAEYQESPAVQGRIRKLGRGIANIITCPAELVRTPELISRREGYLTAATVGLLDGAWRTLIRGATGIYEVLTFYSEVPDGYRPLMQPEFVWEHGHWTE